MNTSAERHLAKAAGYVAKGEEFHRKAAAEIQAALSDGATQKEAARALKRSEGWVSELLAWVRDPNSTGSLYAKDSGRRTTNAAKQLLREAPLEQVEQIISELPAERQQDVAAAAGHAYMKARQTYRQEERNLTPAKRKEREAAAEAMTRPVVTWTHEMQLLSSLEGAHMYLTELNSGGEGQVTRELVGRVEEWLNKIAAEIQVSRAMVGLPINLDNEEVRS